MAKPGNSNRRKRKYTETRKAKTAANATNRQRKQDHRTARLVARTQALLGTHVRVRHKDLSKLRVGTVTEILRKGDDGYPTDARRHHGAYLRVRTTTGDVIASRHRSKPTP
jgi:hypothetical protein